MSHSYPDYLRHCPWRPTDWRWQRAQALVCQGRYFSRKRDDAETGEAVHYLRRLARCASERDLERLARAYPDVHAARLLHEGAGGQAVEAQARLLARQSPQEAAAALGLPAGVVEAYEALF